MVVGLVVVKPQHLPEIMQGLGGVIARLKRLQNQFRSELSEVSQVKSSMEKEARQTKASLEQQLLSSFPEYSQSLEEPTQPPLSEGDLGEEDTPEDLRETKPPSPPKEEES